MKYFNGYFNGIANTLAVFGGFFAYLFGGWDTLIQVLILLMGIDYVTGIFKSIYNKKLSSKIGRKGIIRKFQILAIVSVAVVCEKIGIPAMREITIMFFAANEGISILENTSEMGIPIPAHIKSALLQVREKAEKEEI